MKHQRTINIRIRTNEKKKEYKEKMRESARFYNACLRMSKYNYYNYINKIGPKEEKEIKEYELEEWIKDPKLNIREMASYGDDFIKKISKKIKSELSEKEKQTILRQVARDWKSYFKGKKEAEGKRKVRIPNEKKRYMTCEYNRQMLLKSKKRYEETREIGLTGTVSTFVLPRWIELKDIQSVRLRMTNSYIYIDVIYNKEIKKNSKKKSCKYVAAVDPGMKKIMTIAFNQMKKPIAIKNNKIAQANLKRDKRIEKYREKIKQDRANKKLYKRKILEETEYRNREIKREMHKISNYVVNLLEEEGVGKLVFGHNKGQKQKMKLRKKTKKQFKNIPFHTLKEMLRYKCEEKGIKFVETEESYTSKASFLSKDKLLKYGVKQNKKIKYSGVRISRGMYKDNKQGMNIHADVNGAYNIMRKARVVGTEKIRKAIVQHKRTIEPFGISI